MLNFIHDTVSIETRLQSGQPRHHVLTPGSGKRLFLFTNVSTLTLGLHPPTGSISIITLLPGVAARMKS